MSIKAIREEIRTLKEAVNAPAAAAGPSAKAELIAMLDRLARNADQDSRPPQAHLDGAAAWLRERFAA